MIEKLLMGLIGTSVAGGGGIFTFCCLSWIFRKTCGARSRKNGWILIAVCLLMPLNLVTLPHAYTIQLPKILFLFWLAGALVLTAYHFIEYQRMRHRVKRWSRDCQHETVQKTATDIAVEIGLKRIPTIKSTAFNSSFTMGMLRTNVYLPDGDFLEKDLYYILKHELIHCKERDILWKLLFLAANIIHWFNPLVWLMRRLAENDIEQVCDEGVLKNASKEEREEYSEMILSWVEKSQQKQSPVTTGYMTGMVFLKWRFANIFDTNHKKNGVILLGAMCVLMLLFSRGVHIGASETIYQANQIPIDFGIESRTDLNGDGKEDRVRTMDSPREDGAYTQIVANVDGADVAIKDYKGNYDSFFITGDLTGNGKGDMLLELRVRGSDYGAVEISILHLEGTELVEYPYHFIHNPQILLEQPIKFGNADDCQELERYIGATLFEKNGKTMVRFISLPEDNDDGDIVKCTEVSYREDGWYIEDIRIIHDFYSSGKYKELLAPVYSYLYASD